MSIYEKVNELLEDKNIDSAEVFAICWGPSLGFRVKMDDGSERHISERDYRTLDDHLEEMNRYWRSMQEDE